MTQEPTNGELAEALRSIEDLPPGTRLIVRLAADRLSPRAEEYDFGDDPDNDPWVGEDGWIEWGGGECPVSGDTYVECEFDSEPRGPERGLAAVWRWDYVPHWRNIVRYRAVKGAP